MDFSELLRISYLIKDNYGDHRNNASEKEVFDTLKKELEEISEYYTNREKSPVNKDSRAAAKFLGDKIGKTIKINDSAMVEYKQKCLGTIEDRVAQFMIDFLDAMASQGFVSLEDFVKARLARRTSLGYISSR